ncbi:MAG TPA: hypothetical protein VN755_12055, partial [Steroidobacteraceae bacterium]|nr:hypothetical protein [Steroidobacteraceae bacterium]
GAGQDHEVHDHAAELAIDFLRVLPLFHVCASTWRCTSAVRCCSGKCRRCRTSGFRAFADLRILMLSLRP